MRLDCLAFGMLALVTGAAAQGEEAETPYAQVGDWQISASPPSQRCIMHRAFRSKDGKKRQELTVLYAADKEGVLLDWSNDWMTYLPAKGELNLGLAFKSGAAIDESWGSRDLHYDKVAGSYHFLRAFVRPEETRRILHDLSANQMIGISLGPALIAKLPLDASAAVEKLRECSRQGGRVTG